MAENPAKPASYHTFTTEDNQVFHFRKPSTEQLNLVALRSKKAPLTAALEVTKNIVEASQKSRWEAVLDDKPGYASAVMDDIMELLGFPIRG